MNGIVCPILCFSFKAHRWNISLISILYCDIWSERLILFHCPICMLVTIRLVKVVKRDFNSFNPPNIGLPNSPLGTLLPEFVPKFFPEFNAVPNVMVERYFVFWHRFNQWLCREPIVVECLQPVGVPFVLVRCPFGWIGALFPPPSFCLFVRKQLMSLADGTLMPPYVPGDSRRRHEAGFFERIWHLCFGEEPLQFPYLPFAHRWVCCVLCVCVIWFTESCVASLGHARL